MIKPFQRVIVVSTLVGIFACSLASAKEAPVIGKITGIQEIFPLRLTLATALGKQKVQLTTETVLQNGEETIEAGKLRNDQHVIITGKLDGDTMVAQKIEIAEVVQGEIVAIMEVFPLRLSVKTKDSKVSVQLAEKTRILRKRKTIEMGELRNGDQVRIIGTKSSKDALFQAGEIVLASKD